LARCRPDRNAMIFSALSIANKHDNAYQSRRPDLG
jgi:hypothetical protein